MPKMSRRVNCSPLVLIKLVTVVKKNRVKGHIMMMIMIMLWLDREKRKENERRAIKFTIAVSTFECESNKVCQSSALQKD